MSVESPWRKQVQRKKSDKGDYWLLSRSNGSEPRESISLGYGLKDEEAAACEAGINYLVEFRNVVNRVPTRGPQLSMGPPPATTTEVFPMPASAPGGSWVPLYVSPDYLKRVLREAVTPTERDLAQEKVRGFLLKMAEARPEGQKPVDEVAVVRTVQEIARAAKLGGDPGEMPLKLYYESMWKAERKAKRPKSWESEENRWDTYILPALGHVAVRDLDGPTFDAFITSFKLKNGEEPAGYTRANVRGAYAALLTYAARKGHRKGGAKHEFYKLDGTTERKRPIEALTLEEIDRILKAASNPMHRALFAFAFDEGTRPKEVGRLDWKHVDFRCTPKAPYGMVRIPGTKTELSEAVVPLYPMAREHLLAWHLKCGSPSNGQVFSWQGKTYEGQSTFRSALKRAARKAGITGKRIFPNLARHTAATTAADAGVLPAQIALQLRHSDTTMVEETYDLRNHMSKIDAGAFPDRRVLSKPKAG